MPKFKVWVNTYFSTSTPYEVEAANKDDAKSMAMGLHEVVDTGTLHEAAEWMFDEVLDVEVR
jgi:hypothetical protein